jgi:predicted XRE-type DNA-binding protein
LDFSGGSAGGIPAEPLQKTDRYMESNNEITLYQHDNKGEIALYQPDDTIVLEVKIESETVWLTQAQIAQLFGVDRSVVTKHLRNIFSVHELDEDITCAIFAHVGNDGKQQYRTKYYNLDGILSVGYRVNSINATAFRRWASSVLKEYLLRGYAINRRFERLEHRVTETENKINFFVKTSLPPVEGVLFDGQTFDAYVFVADLIKSAKKSIVLIDNYVDESVLLILSKRKNRVNATIYTGQITSQFRLDLQKHNAQYPSISVKTFTRSHDRFLIIDNDVYHIGASLKDMGKKWFAFSKMVMDATSLLKNIK